MPCCVCGCILKLSWKILREICNSSHNVDDPELSAKTVLRWYNRLRFVFSLFKPLVVFHTPDSNDSQRTLTQMTAKELTQLISPFRLLTKGFGVRVLVHGYSHENPWSEGCADSRQRTFSTEPFTKSQLESLPQFVNFFIELRATKDVNLESAVCGSFWEKCPATTTTTTCCDHFC